VPNNISRKREGQPKNVYRQKEKKQKRSREGNMKYISKGKITKN
jgi:hypothetical protein